MNVIYLYLLKINKVEISFFKNKIQRKKEFLWNIVQKFINFSKMEKLI